MLRPKNSQFSSVSQKQNLLAFPFLGSSLRKYMIIFPCLRHLLCSAQILTQMTTEARHKAQLIFQSIQKHISESIPLGKAWYLLNKAWASCFMSVFVSIPCCRCVNLTDDKKDFESTAEITIQHEVHYVVCGLTVHSSSPTIPSHLELAESAGKLGETWLWSPCTPSHSHPHFQIRAEVRLAILSATQIVL